MIPSLIKIRRELSSAKISVFRNLALIVFLILLIPAVTTATDSTLDWTLATGHAQFSERNGQSTVVYDNNLWVIGGMQNYPTFYSDVWRSGDGINWELVTPKGEFGQRTTQGSVVFNDKMWVIAGREGGSMNFVNNIWYSTDGISWTEATSHAPFDPRTNFACVVYDNKIWVIGGNVNDGSPGNDVWYSSDGISWTEATSHAGFSPRMDPSASVFDGKIWVTGGFDWRGVYNDVWTTTDGITWTQVTPHAPFSPRRYQNIQVADGKLWVIGGLDGQNSLNDVWYTADGVTWNQAKANNSYTPRWGFSSAVFNDRFFVIAGSGNDVWYSGNLEDYSSGTSTGQSIVKTATNDHLPVVLEKAIVPQSLKQGTDARITLSVSNEGNNLIHDIEILDKIPPGFSFIEGTRSLTLSQLEPGEKRILSYVIRADKPGSFRMPEASVMYADQDGNYHVGSSNTQKVTVMAPLIPSPQQPGSPDLPIELLVPVGILVAMLVCIVIYSWAKKQ